MAIGVNEKDDKPVDPTGPADWIALGYCALAILLLFLVDGLSYWRRIRDRVISFKVRTWALLPCLCHC